jgi:hypothetical protein
MTQLRDRMLEELERRNYSPGAKPGFSDGDFRASHSARCSLALLEVPSGSSATLPLRARTANDR